MGKKRKIGEGNERPDPVETVAGLVDFLEFYDPPKYPYPTPSTRPETTTYQTPNSDTELLTNPVAQALASQSDPALNAFRDNFGATEEDINDITSIIAMYPELQGKVRKFLERVGYPGNPDYLNPPEDS